MLIVLTLLVNVAAMNLDGLVSLAGVERPSEGAAVSQFSSVVTASPVEVAEALGHAGVEAGADIGLVGYGYTALWAYLAQLRIVTEVQPREAGRFWEAMKDSRETLLDVFRASGASYVVAEIPPTASQQFEGWTRLGQTGLWLLDLGDP